MTKLLFVVAVTVVAAASVAVLASHSDANASTAGDPRIPVLQAQVKTLQTQVKALTKLLASENGQLQVNFTADTCLTAQVADLFQGTWGVIDQLGQATQQKAYFGPQQQVTDYQNCSQLTSPTVPRGAIATPPTISPLVPLLQWLHE